MYNLKFLILQILLMNNNEYIKNSINNINENNPIKFIYNENVKLYIFNSIASINVYNQR